MFFSKQDDPPTLSREEWVERMNQDFDITPADVEANRRGEFSERQCALIEPRVNYAAGNPNCFTVLMILGIVGVIALIVLNMALDGLVVAFLSTPLYGGMVAVFGAILGVAVIFSAVSTNRMRHSMDHMDKIIMHTAEGPARKHFRFRETPNTLSLSRDSVLHPLRWKPTKRRAWTVSFGETELYFYESHAENFLEGAVYRVYYLRLAYATYLLSAELIEMP